MTTQEIKVVLSADPSQLQGATAKGEQALVKFVNAAKATTGGLNGVGTASVSTSRAMAMLSPQITDIVTSLQAGQNPLTVFIQQGGQIKDVFGGIGPALRGVASLITPLSVALTAAAAAGGSFIYAMYDAAAQSQKFHDINLLTGSSLGLTEAAFRKVTEAAAENTTSTRGSARAFAEAYAQSGRISGDALQTVVEASLRLERRSGQTKESIIADMLAMTRGVTDAATKQNEQMHFLTAAQIDYVRGLENAGKKTEAMIYVLHQQDVALGNSATWWERVTAGASKYYEVFSKSLRAEDSIERITRLQKELAQTQADLADGPAGFLDYGAYQNAQTRVKTLSQQIADQSINVRDGAQRAGNRAYLKKEEEEKATRTEKLIQLTNKLSGVNFDYAKSILTISEAYQKGDITAQAQTDLIDQAKGFYFKPKQVKTAAELQAEQERQYRTMVEGILKNRPTSLAEIEAKNYEAANKAAIENMSATAENLRKRNEQAAEFGFQLRDQTQQINIGLIADDRARGEATISLDREVMQHRLDLLAQQGADITQAQEDLNANILARQRALNEQLMPQYAKNLRDWEDTQRLMYDSTNSLQDAWLRDGEDAWVQFAQTGKLSVKSLVDDVIAEFARLQFRQNIAGGLSSLLNIGIAYLSGGSGTGITNDTTGSLVDNGLGAGRASGGKVYPRTLHPIVERGEPELLTTPNGTYLATGAQGGYVTPLRALSGAAGQGGAPVVNVNIEGAPNGAQVSSQPNNQGGTDVLVKFIQQAKNAVADDIQSGGSVARAMQGSFGLRRATPARA